MAFNPYTRVMLRTDRFAVEGAKRGDIGWIIEVYSDDAYEVEFSDAKGISYAQILVAREDIEVPEQTD